MAQLQTAAPLRGESSAQASIRKLSDQQAQLYAQQIVEMWATADARQSHDATLRRRQQAAEALGLRATDTNVIPLFIQAQ
jgi:hypothetical protein